MSDQDFFFDDEEVEEVVEDKKDKKEKADSKPKKKETKPAKVVDDVDLDDGAAYSGPTITATICALLALIALLVGVIGGIFIGRSLVPPVAATSTGTGTGGGMGGMGSGGNAPILSDEQMQQGMPEGHPQVGGTEVEDETDATPDTVEDDTVLETENPEKTE